MALLFFGGYFAGDLKGRIAGDAAEAADPATRAVIWNKREGRTILERRRGRAQRAADDLPTAAFEFEARPAVIFVGAAEFEAQRHRARYGKFVAVAAQDRKVERFAAARFLIAVFLQLEIVDGDHRAKREAADARVVGERTRSRPQRGDRKSTRLNSSH